MNPIQNFNQVSANELLNNAEYNKRSIAPPIHATPPTLEREYYLVIDSRFRKSNENSNNYKISLDEPLKDIREITLTNATIPKRSKPTSMEYKLVVSLTQQITTTESGKDDKIEIKQHYQSCIINVPDNTPSNLTNLNGLNYIDVAVVTIGTDNKFKFQYNDSGCIYESSTSNVTRTVTSINIHLDESSLGIENVLGFNSRTTYSNSTIIESDIFSDATYINEEDHIYLHIENFSIFNYTGHKTNNKLIGCVGANYCFSNIALKCDAGNTYFFSEDSPCTIEFKTKKSMLSTMGISWKNVDGSLYEFDKGKNHNLTLKIVCGEEKK